MSTGKRKTTGNRATSATEDLSGMVELTEGESGEVVGGITFGGALAGGGTLAGVDINPTERGGV